MTVNYKKPMEIRLREFQRHLHKYLAEECKIMGKRGELIGVYVPVIKSTNDSQIKTNDSQVEIKAEEKEKGEVLKDLFDRFDYRKKAVVEEKDGQSEENDSQISEDEDKIVLPKPHVAACGRCNRVAQIVALWSGWHEERGEEVKNLRLCRNCSRGRKDVTFLI